MGRLGKKGSHSENGERGGGLPQGFGTATEEGVGVWLKDGSDQTL